MEIWKILKDFPNYSVSSLGRVKNNKTKKFLLPCECENGYFYVSLCRQGKRKSIAVHRLVAIAFIPNFQGKREVNHINGDKSDNSVENLEWTTSSENKIHAASVLGKYKAKKVLCVESGIVFGSVREAANFIQKSYCHLNDCLRGRYPTCAGLHWKYVDEVEVND